MYWIAVAMGLLLGALPSGKIHMKQGKFSYSVVKKGKTLGSHYFVIEATKKSYQITSVKEIKPEEGGRYRDSTVLYLNRKNSLPIRADVWTDILIGNFGPIKAYYDINFEKGVIEMTSISTGDTTPKKTTLKIEEIPWLIEPFSFVSANLSLKKGKTYSFKLFFPATKQTEDATLKVGDIEKIGKVKARKLDVTYKGREFIFWVNRKVKPYLLKVEDLTLGTEEIPK